MNQHEQEVIVDASALQNVCSRLYQKVGVAQSDAETVAEMQVLMDLRGVHSHATRAVPGYVRGIISGSINPTPELKTLAVQTGYRSTENPCRNLNNLLMN